MSIKRNLFYQSVKKYTPQQRHDYVQAYTASGMNMREWCITNDVSIHTFSNWLYKKDRTRNTHPMNLPTWAAVEVAEPIGTNETLTSHHHAIRIDISGIILQVEEGVQAEHLRMVLREVRGL